MATQARRENPTRIQKSPSLYRHGFKRVLDVALVILAAVFVVPLVLILALAVMIDGGSPFFWSERVGKGGRIFRMMKLRTMVPDAAARLDAFLASNPDAAREWRSTQKLKLDPRITPIGRFLRKSSIDELPQLWNVLIGEMSLVGPRPMMPCQRDLYPGKAYYTLRPGVTGPWQVSDRNESEFVTRAVFDHKYSETLSFMGDVSLIVRTASVVIRGTGY